METPWNKPEAELPEWLKFKPQFEPSPLSPPPPLAAAMQGGTPPSYSPPPEEKPAIILQNRVIVGRKLLETHRTTKDATLMWAKRVKFALFSIFGKDAAIVRDLNTIIKEAEPKGLLREQFAQRLADVESLVDYLNRLGDFPLACPVSQISRVPSTRNVFIIHGHDELNVHRLSGLLQKRFGLNPVIMFDEPGRSRPLINKFEDEAQTCSFAFALFTPDDDIVKPGMPPYKQARPNVINETGWFIGRLGRERVVLIVKTGTEIHSDFDGVSRIEFKENVEEKSLKIEDELKAARIIP